MKRFNKTIAIILCLIMAISSMSMAFGEEVKDYEGHWAEATIQKWIDGGKVSGYPDGSFKPNGSITRAEFVKMVNEIIDYDGKGSIAFNDVTTDDWFYNQVRIAQEIGYISGYSTSQFGPNDNITREQAAAILSRIQYLKDNKDAVSKFTDNSSFSPWAVGSVGAASNAGFINGNSDGSFKPQANLSRAEAVTMLDNVLVNAKNYIVYKDKTQLKDIEILGDLIIAKTVGNGDVYLNNIEVKGHVYVYGGGMNSVYFNNVKVARIEVEKDKVRLVFDDGSKVEEIAVGTETKLENKNGGIGKISVDSEGKVTLSGKFTNVEVVSKADIELSDATITNLVVNEPIKILGTGTVATLTANANGIQYESTAKITKTVVGEKVAEKPAVIKEEPSTPSIPATPDPEEPNPDLDKDFKLVIKSSVTRTTNLGEENEREVKKEVEYHSFKEYKGSTKISAAIGEEIKYVIDKLEKDDELFINKITPYLKILNSKLLDIQVIELNDNDDPDKRTKLYTVSGINWDEIETYLSTSNIVLPDTLKAKNADFSIDDIISVLKLYNPTTLESDLAKIIAKLPKEDISIIPMTWPEEGEVLTLKNNLFADKMINKIVENLFSNDQLYNLGTYSNSVSQDNGETKYKVEFSITAIKLIEE